MSPEAGPAATTSTVSLPRRLICGACMGIADAVPGVSGGTVALIGGIYSALIHHLAAVVACLRQPWDRQRWPGLLAALRFGLPLGITVVLGLYLTSKLLVGRAPDLSGLDLAAGHELLRSQGGWLLHPERAPVVLAVFFGLVAASLSIPWRRRRERRLAHLPLALLGTLVAALVALLPPGAGSVHPLALSLAGALAISVMLLPGISGSLALLVVGMYHPVSAALHDLDLLRIAWVLLGMALGVALVVPLLRRLLTRAHDGTMALLSGLMLGSLVALWPWKTHYVPKQIGEWGPLTPLLPHGQWWWVVLAAMAGAALILLVERLAPARAEEIAR